MVAEQKTKTKKYWDTFYSALPAIDDVNHSATEDDTRAKHHDVNGSPDLEWIAPNSTHLMETILRLLPSSDAPNDGESKGSKIRHISVLEIGCGVSQLSLSLLQRLLLQKEKAGRVRRQAYNFVSTDVSSVCIRQNRTRDDAFIDSLHATDDSLRYEVVDVLVNQESPPRKYDIILDKGTLDTFLFRSKRGKKGSASHPPLLAPLLNNIHCWLRGGCGAKYIIISPRSKIKSVRDFRGFASVRRIKFDTTSSGDRGVLMKSNNEKAARSTSQIYIYECIKNESYNPEEDMPFGLECTADDESICRSCGVTFNDFRGKAGAHHQGTVVWSRRWKNHIVHCK